MGNEDANVNWTCLDDDDDDAINIHFDDKLIFNADNCETHFLCYS